MSQTLDQNIGMWAADLLEELELSLYDVEHVGGVLRIVVQRDGGVPLDAIARLTRGLSPILDERDPIKGTYTLEVSSPGLERRLRTPAHFQGAIGSSVKIKLRKGIAEDRRVTGTLDAVTDTQVTLVDEQGTTQQIDLADIDTARTVYEWQSTPKPGSDAARKAKASDKTAGATKSSTTNKKASS